MFIITYQMFITAGLCLNARVGGVIGNDSTQNYSGGANHRSNLYYDVSIYGNYLKPRKLNTFFNGWWARAN